MNANVVDYAKGERKIVRVSLADITTSHNPRRPVRALQDKFAELAQTEHVEETTPLELVHKFALSSDLAGRNTFVDLIEANEPELVKLAESRAKEEIEPVVLRSFRVKLPGSEIYTERYGVVAGERRILAAAYNHAKNGNGELPTIGAVVKKLTVDEAFDLAVAENVHRADPTDVEEGLIFRQYRERTNPATGKNYTLKEIAELLNMEYQYVRTREALTYLSEADQRRVESGKLGIVAATTKGLAIKSGKDGEDLPDRKRNRSRVMTLAEVQKNFDQNRNDHPKYLEALAAVMRLSLDAAIVQSDKRIRDREEAELAAARKVERRFVKEAK